MNVTIEQLIDEAFEHWNENHARKFARKSFYSVSDIQQSIQTSIQHYIKKHINKLEL